MPTGYTSIIEKGATFERFVWTCARAFGAMIMMRDDSLDAPIPQEFQPSKYNFEEIEKAKARLYDLERLTIEQAESRARAEYTSECQRVADYREEKRQLRQKYDVMLERVRAWEPPTPDHVELKKFMVQQIEESIQFDCGNYEPDEPKLRSGRDWLAKVVAGATRDVAYHEREWKAEVERTKGRNDWMAALRKSVPIK